MKLASLDLHNSIYLEKEVQNEFQISQDQTITFDSFHNSFFESYWSTYTTLKEISLHINLSGSGKIEIIRNINGAEDPILVEEFSETDLTQKTLPIPLRNENKSRIYFKITATSSVLVTNDTCWNTKQTPEKNVKLAVIMCTFNKQEYVHKNIELLKNSSDFMNSNIELIVVDNASNLNLKSSQKIHYFQQGNFGGAGGFTRGLLEARKMKVFSHYQFMDDDILLDPDSILRAVSFMSFTQKEYAFSGSMLCLNKKNYLWEAGADFLTSPSLFSPKPYFHDSDLSSESLTKMSQPYDFEYGAWWFNMFSEEAVSKVGLPTPFFIRGDDIEYGVRLRKNGIRTINLPGVGVWHETFHSKVSLWLTYYGQRNFLIIGLLHASLFKMYYYLYKTTKFVGSNLLFFNYDRNKVVLRSIKDVIFNFYRIHELSTPESQTRLITDLKSLQEEYSEGLKKPNTSQGSILTALIKILTFNFHLIPATTNQIVVIEADNWKRTYLKNKSHLLSKTIMINNKHLNKSLVLKRDFVEFYKQLFEFTFYLVILSLFMPIYYLAYKILFKKYQTTQFWNQFLKLTT